MYFCMHTGANIRSVSGLSGSGWVSCAGLARHPPPIRRSGQNSHVPQLKVKPVFHCKDFYFFLINDTSEPLVLLSAIFWAPNSSRCNYLDLIQKKKKVKAIKLSVDMCWPLRNPVFYVNWSNRITWNGLFLFYELNWNWIWFNPARDRHSRLDYISLISRQVSDWESQRYRAA